RHLLPTEAYARSLVRLVAMAVPRVRTFTPATLGITDGDILEERVMTILQRPHLRASRRILLAAMATMLFVLPTAAVTHLAFDAGIHQAAMITAAPQVATQTATQAAEATAAQNQNGSTTEPQQRVKVRMRSGDGEPSDGGAVVTAGAAERERALQSSD